MTSELSPAAVQVLESGISSSPQVEHRLALLRKWKIPQGSKVLEIGCGQGDCTILLADLVGENGHVTAIDPASLDYGAPMTLGEAQSQLKASPLGNRITFKQTTVEEFCQTNDEIYDCAVFARCLWYLPSPDILLSMLRSLRGRVRRVLIAEFLLDLQGDIAVLPHMLAVISLADINIGQPSDPWTSNDNVQSICSPKMIREMGRETGWELETESIIEAAEGLEDGRWEVGHVLSESYAARVESLTPEPRRVYAKMLLDAVKQSTATQPLAAVRALPTWFSSWKPSS
ncbi:hypothetical protein N7478_006487 [Penicillium angulare]|uniref:uncharacterized protein n=1 Tax=Penicillium angulare TaxID=116970 RepID=UPI00254048EA|nr:uncharacterized protein N7478_006487 [Penicillium angulare]KAJ5281115.1 hypothetical protein N7478_006487 [Penicillium angulare]